MSLTECPAHTFEPPPTITFDDPDVYTLIGPWALERLAEVLAASPEAMRIIVSQLEGAGVVIDMERRTEVILGAVKVRQG